MKFSEMRLYVGCAVLALSMLSGCKSAQDKAIDQAKQQAAATGQAQQVVSVDKGGNRTITTVQPPVAGQTGQQVTTVTQPAGGVPANTPATADNMAPAQPATAGAAAPAPGAPVIRPADIDIPAGTDLTIRINEHISVKTTPPGAQFSGELADAVRGRDGQVVAPRGTAVRGVVDESHRRGHFKGSSVLELRLTSMDLNGQRYDLATRDAVRTKKGKGKRSAAFIGGGSGLGMLVGGIASGGVGLVIGGLAGAGGGTALAGATGNRDLDIPSESIIHFRLADDLAVEQQ